MDINQKIRWDKLSLGLELLTVSDPNSLMPVILDIHSLIFNEDDTNNTLRKLNFMGYELQTRTENLTEMDRQSILSDYIFNEKHFLISALSNKTIDQNDWQLPYTVETKQGCSFIISLIYVYLAQNLELPIYLINSKEDNILKWVHGNKPTFLDITTNATPLTEKKMCEVLLEMNKSRPDIPVDSFDILPAKDIINKYLMYLLNIFNLKKQLGFAKTTLDILIKLEPANLQHLHSRALINKKLHCHKEALNDIRRYYSLNGEENTPVELKVAYYELKNMSTPASKLIH